MDVTEDLHLEALREQILLAALPNVPFDGWTLGVLRAAARNAGLDPADALRAFPRGPIDAIAYWSALADRRMAEALAERNLPELSVRERVATAIRVRFEQAAPYREALRRALSVLAMPQNAAVAARSLYRTVDAIWYACGDRATDFNFYTKRGLLAGVYSASLLYWLNDESEGFNETWAFIDRRIADVMVIPRVQADIGRVVAHLPNPFRLLPSRLFRGASGARWR